MALVVGLALLVFSVCCYVDGFPSFSLVGSLTMSINVTELPEAMDCGNEEYHDIRFVSFLRFSTAKAARRKHHLSGDNEQLQCRDPNTCSFSGYPEEASCYNTRVNQLSNPLWDCTTKFPDRRYTFGNIRVSCEILSENLDFCILRDSCILFYIPSKEASLLLGFALTTMSMASFFCLLAVLCSVKRHRAESEPVVSISSRSLTGQSAYNPATDLPPSYSFVQRNPQCFEKPNREIVKPLHAVKERALSESPPPSYDACSGEE